MARVDEHVIQGQLAARWYRNLNCSLIVVVNDQIAQDNKRQGILEMTLSDDIPVLYYSFSKAVVKLPRLLKIDERILLITENLEDIVKLAKIGLPIPTLNMGIPKTNKVDYYTCDWDDFNSDEQWFLHEIKRLSVPINFNNMPTS